MQIQSGDGFGNAIRNGVHPRMDGELNKRVIWMVAAPNPIPEHSGSSLKIRRQTMMEMSRAHSSPLSALPGYWAQLGIPEPGAALLEHLQAGFAFVVLKRLAAVSGVPQYKLAAMVGLSRYALRQSRKRGRFSMAHSHQLYRVARVLAAAQTLFEGNWEAARMWLQEPQWGLGGRRPVELLSTEVGAEAVCDLLGRIEHGVMP
ncbi:type II RES/Xre toxin-antitoxin system antitoxin [Metapseudomonas boanensis]|uniref:DUF2384 domain-containing protein n=1 Tax=Metapseudomonas boanensis TaxID=2822138 RepID=A0ABS5XJ56_9GAMM|nr:antitoxin Xre/MbcA/ParS toxin-binding domain-containing protein [Pseudomonas boanensis]MBT8767333.1 DUF2384 domain-containing protein [Pseudomonas boanensis]